MKFKFKFLIAASVVLAVMGCANRARQSNAPNISAQQARVIGMVSDINACREAIKQNPNNADAHMCVAEDTIGINNAEAVQELRIVTRLQPGNHKADFLLAQTLIKVGQRDAARKVYQQLASQNDKWGKGAQARLQKLSQ